MHPFIELTNVANVKIDIAVVLIAAMMSANGRTTVELVSGKSIIVLEDRSLIKALIEEKYR
jgi:hypothetical protein